MKYGVLKVMEGVEDGFLMLLLLLGVLCHTELFKYFYIFCLIIKYLKYMDI